MPRLLACLVAAAAAGPAAACLNDRELPSHEREFRSQYDSPQQPPHPLSLDRPGNTAMYSVGAVFVVGAVGLTLARRRPVA